MDVTPGSGYDHTKKWGVIRVTNAGRRPSYVSHVAFKIPKGYDHSHLVIMGGITGKKLSEGDPTEIFVVAQDVMKAYAKDWKRVIAQVTDSTGKDWCSKPPKEKPSWAK
jgi:RIO-like serine/threonine protein kinase